MTDELSSDLLDIICESCQYLYTEWCDVVCYPDHRAYLKILLSTFPDNGMGIVRHRLRECEEI